MTRGGRALRENVERFFSFGLASRLQRMPEKDFRAEVVTGTREYGSMVRKFASVGAIDAPSRQNTRQSVYVLLGIAAIDAERVQLHHLARKVLVESLSVTTGGRTSGGCVQCIVEINEHRRMFCHGKEQVTESAQREGTDRPLLVVADP